MLDPIVHYCRSAFWLHCSNRSISMPSHGRLFLTLPLPFFEPSPKGPHLKFGICLERLAHLHAMGLGGFFLSFFFFCVFVVIFQFIHLLPDRIMCMHHNIIESSRPAKSNVPPKECPRGPGISYTCRNRLVLVACHDSRLGNPRSVIVIWDLTNYFCFCCCYYYFVQLSCCCYGFSKQRKC